MEFHGNSNKNEKAHHLYAIFDFELDELFKFGISDKIVGSDGYSSRMRDQVEYLNAAVGWGRYYAVVIQDGITGKLLARAVEDEFIDAYRDKFGHNPRIDR